MKRSMVYLGVCVAGVLLAGCGGGRGARFLGLKEVNEVRRGTGVVAIVGARVVDGRGGAAIEDGVVVVRDGVIAAVGRRGVVQVPDGAEVVEGRGMTVTPGLVDAHFHLDGRRDRPGVFLRNGVTSVRDPGAWISAYEGVRKSGEQLPRMFLTGPHLDCAPVAHPKDAVVVTSAAEARAAVDRAADEGASAIKVYFRLPLEWIKEATAAAHAAGIPVLGHLELVKATDAIGAGLDGLEHVTSLGTALAEPAAAEEFEAAVRASNAARGQGRYALWAGIDLEKNERVESVLKLVKERGTVLVPTLAVFEARAGDKKATPDSVAGFERMIRFTGMYARAGGPVVVGSHSEVPKAAYGWAYQREMELLVESGMTPAEVRRSGAATLEGARWLGAADRLGSLEVGKRADLVLVEGNPLAEIGAMKNVRRVMIDGAWVKAGAKVEGELLK